MLGSFVTIADASRSCIGISEKPAAEKPTSTQLRLRRRNTSWEAYWVQSLAMMRTRFHDQPAKTRARHWLPDVAQNSLAALSSQMYFLLAKSWKAHHGRHG